MRLTAWVFGLKSTDIWGSKTYIFGTPEHTNLGLQARMLGAGERADLGS